MSKLGVSLIAIIGSLLIAGITSAGYLSIPKLKEETGLEGEVHSFWFTVLADNQKLADEVMVKLEKTLLNIRRDLNITRRLGKKCLVIVWEDRDQYEEGVINLGIYGGLSAKAFYLSSQGSLPHLICLYHDEVLFTEVLPHELTHLVLKIALNSSGKSPIPLWLNEGLAEAETDQPLCEVAEEVMQAKKECEYIPLRKLVSFQSYPDEYTRTRLFYVESSGLVRFLLRNQTYPGEFFDLAKRLSFWGGDFMGILKKTYERKYQDFDSLELDFLKFIEANLPQIDPEKEGKE